MPRIKGLGHLDWRFDGAQRNMVWDPKYECEDGSLGGYVTDDGSDKWTPAALSYYEREDYTRIVLLLRPDSPDTIEHGWICQDYEHAMTGKFTPELLRFRKLFGLGIMELPGNIVFLKVENGISIAFDLKGRVKSPEGLMQGIVRRLSSD